MINLKFKRYDSGFVRCYFTHNTTLYCVQAGYNYLPELLICSRDGEPSHPVENPIEYTDDGVISHYSLTNMPPDGDTWSWNDILAYFNSTEITSNGQLIKRMNDLFEVNE
jgi:uncharacterized OB-fold protein